MGLFVNYNTSINRIAKSADFSSTQGTAMPNFSFNFPCIFDNIPLNYIPYNPFLNGAFSFQTNFLPQINQLPSMFLNTNNFNFQNPFSFQNTPSLMTNYSNPASLSFGTDVFVKSSSVKPTAVQPAVVSQPVKTQSYKASNFNNNSVVNLSWWKAQGYNEEKGKELAANTKKHSDALKAQGITAQCGRGVRLGINDTYYNGSLHYERFGQARLTGDVTLSNDSNFKKIDIQGLNLSKEDIPAGAIVIYDSGYSNGKYSYCGHIEVADGNGHGYSDFTSTLLQNRGVRKEPKEIWIPV